MEALQTSLSVCNAVQFACSMSTATEQHSKLALQHASTGVYLHLTTYSSLLLFFCLFAASKLDDLTFALRLPLTLFLPNVQALLRRNSCQICILFPLINFDIWCVRLCRFQLNQVRNECEDIDECNEEPCVGGTCRNSLGSFECTCPINYIKQKNATHTLCIGKFFTIS